MPSQKNKETESTTPIISKTTIFARENIFGITISLLSLIFLGIYGYLIIQKIFQPETIAKTLPAENTILFLELNHGIDNEQSNKTFELLKKHPLYSRENIIKIIEEKLKIDYSKNIEPWLGNKIGIALLNDRENYEIAFVYFAQIKNHNAAEEFFPENTPEGLHAAIFNNYLFLSPNQIFIEKIINPDTVRLHTTAEFRRINNNLPINKTGLIYIDYQLLDNTVYNKLNLPIDNITPLLSRLKSEGIAIIAQEDKFLLHDFTNVTDTGNKETNLFNIQEKYTASLANYLPQDTIFFWGATDLNHQASRFLESILNREIDTNITQIIENQLQQLAGNNFDYQNEILPLLENEFAITLEKYQNQPQLKLISKITPDKNEKLKIVTEKLLTLFSSTQTKIIGKTLADGTYAEEIIIVDPQITNIEQQYKNFIITETNAGDISFSLYTARIEDFFILSSKIELIYTSIDSYLEPQNSLATSPEFQNTITPLITNVDQLTYYNISELLPTILPNSDFQKYFQGFKSFASGKSYFNDGIITQSYLTVE